MEKINKKSWLNFLVLYLGAVVLSMSQLKITPISNEVSKVLNITATETSLLVSIFTSSALFLSLPSGKLISKFGVKKISVLMMATLFLGNVIGAFSNSYRALLVSRVIEGMSFAMINMVGIIFINHWFDRDKTGTPIGIFGTFSATASLVAMNVYRPIYKSHGLKSVWIFTAGLSLIAVLGYYFLFDNVEENGPKEEGSFKEAGKNKYTWILSFAIGCMSLVLFTFLALYPTILMETQGIGPGKANYYAGLFGLFGVPFGLVAGIIIDKTNRPGRLAFLTNIVTIVASVMLLFVKENLILVQVFLLSSAISMNSTSINISIQRASDKRILSYSLAILYLFYYIGTFIGAPVTTYIAEKIGWNFGLLFLGLVAVVGTVFLLYYVVTFENKEVNLVKEDLNV